MRDKTKIDLLRLDKLLSEIPEISHIDLYGGEIGALKKSYFNDMKSIIRNHYQGEINIITNFSMLHEGFFEEDVYLSVSYDFEAREKSEKVFMNMMQSPVPIAVLVLASPEVIAMDVDNMIQTINMCSAVESLEIKPYSTNQANAFDVSHKDFEEFVKKWISSPVEKKFDFINLEKIEDCIDGKYNAFSDDHIYITPSGKYGVLEFDSNDNEYFLELDTIEDYYAWTSKEKAEMSPICKACPHFGKCLTEHYRYVTDLENSCNGYKGLLDWYERLED